MISFTLALALGSISLGDSQPTERQRLEVHLPDIVEWTASADHDAGSFVEDGMTADLGWTPPQVAMSAFDGNRLIFVAVSYNWVWLAEGGPRRPIWFARLRAVAGGHRIERFADGRTCPALETSLGKLKGLPAITLRVPDLPTVGLPAAGVAEDLSGFALDDITYTLRMPGRFEAPTSTETVTIVGGSFAPLAHVFIATLADLKGCWTQTVPPRR